MVPAEKRQPALGRAVRQIRQERGLKQEALAYEAGVTIATVSLLERGMANPTWSTMTAIATTLGVSVAELATLAGTLED